MPSPRSMTKRISALGVGLFRHGWHRWVVLAERDRLRWGGDLRRAFIFRRLAERTGAISRPSWRGPGVARALAPARGRVGWRGRPFVVTAELLDEEGVAAVRSLGRPLVLDFHDDPVAQVHAFGLPLDDVARLRAQVEANLGTFERIVVQSETFRALVGLPVARCLVAPNGTDTTHIRPLPMPDRPIVGQASGAAPGRGIEELVEAVGIARATIPELELRLWLVATGESSEAYLAGLRASLAGRSWARIETAPYADIGQRLAEAMVLCVPLPVNPYMDGVLPIKLFDSMAAGRPIVATPCRETAALLRSRDAGHVAEGDTPEAIAAGLVTAFAEAERSARWAANARKAAEQEFDWRVVGDRLADEILRYARS